MVSATLLSFVGLLSLALGANGAIGPIWTAHTRGEIKNNADGSISLIAVVQGGSPIADKFHWVLPGGRTLDIGWSSGSFQALLPKTLPDGGKQLVLMLRHYNSSSPQLFVLKAEATNHWTTSFNFRLQMRRAITPIVQDRQFSRFRVETKYNGDGSVLLQVTVTGGKPKPDNFEWTLPSSGDIIPGQTSGLFSASWPKWNSDGSKTYALNMRGGLLSTPQNVVFKAEAMNAWNRTSTFSLPAKAAPAPRTGNVVGTSRYDRMTRQFTIAAELIGGSPKPTSFLWTIQMPDGRSVDLEPGQGDTTPVRNNAKGNPSTTATMYGLFNGSRKVKLHVSSNDADGRLQWYAAREWTISSIGQYRWRYGVKK